MTNIKALALQLNQQILECDEIKEFKKYELLLHEHEELAKLEKQIKALQKDIVHKKSKQEDVEDTIGLYLQLKEEFENHPIVVNYMYHLEEANSLLQTINQQINGQLK